MLCAFFLLTQTLACGKTTVAKRSIVAEAVNGEVTSEKSGETVKLKKGEKLKSGSSVSVPTASDLTLLIDSDRHVFADSETSFSLKAVNEGTKIVLETGKLVINIESKLKEDETFEVSSKNAIMSVRGTKFTVIVRKDGEAYFTELSVEEGAVEVKTTENGEEKTFTVKPGESKTLEGSAPGSDYVPPVKENKTEAEPKAEAEPIKLYSDTLYPIDIGKYEEFGRAYGGIVPVKYDGHWGAVTYYGSQVVPFRYDGFKNPNDKGYFVLKNASESFLFDRKGNQVFELAEGDITASSDGFVTATWTQYNGEDADLYYDFFSTKYDYYRYDGSLVNSVETGFAERMMDSAHGSYDGKTTIVGNIKPEVFDRNNVFDSIIPFDFGLMDKDGNIEWVDADGINEDDSSAYMDKASGLKAIEEAQNNSRGVGLAAGQNWVELPNGPANNGYILSYGPVESGLFLRDNNGIVAWIYPWDMRIENGKLVYYEDIMPVGGYYNQSVHIYGGGYDDSQATYCHFWHDGDWVYNYGSKLLINADDQYALCDFAGGELKYKIFDYCRMSDQKYWLISTEGKWGYCDHDGNVVKLFDDACEFGGGFAVVIEDGVAYEIDESFNVIGNLGYATSVAASGELFRIVNGEEATYYVPKRNDLLR